MKNILFALAAALGLAFSVQAQTPGLYSSISGGTNYVASGATNSYSTLSQAVGDYTTAGIMFAYLGGGAGATNAATLVGYRMVGNEWDSAPFVRLALTGTGAARMVASTNVNVAGVAAIGHWQVEWPSNGASAAITNVTVQTRLTRPVYNAR